MKVRMPVGEAGWSAAARRSLRVMSSQVVEVGLLIPATAAARARSDREHGLAHPQRPMNRRSGGLPRGPQGRQLADELLVGAGLGGRS